MISLLINTKVQILYKMYAELQFFFPCTLSGDALHLRQVSYNILNCFKVIQWTRFPNSKYKGV